jgi:hypothetical protein
MAEDRDHLSRLDDQTKTSTAAAPVEDLAAAKERALAAINARLALIDRLQEKVADVEALTDAHQTALEADLAAFETGLQAVATAVSNATSIEQVKEVIRDAKADFPVGGLLIPKVHLVIRADKLVAMADELLAMAAASTSTTATAAIDTTMVTGAKTLAAAVPGMVLPLTAEDWPDPATEVLQEARDDLREARRMLQEARGLVSPSLQVRPTERLLSTDHPTLADRQAILSERSRLADFRQRTDDRSFYPTDSYPTKRR